MILAGSVTEASALGRAADWMQAVIQGPIMTAVAVLAISAIGFAMLNGQLPVRRGMIAVLGCFIAFGASAIAHAIVTLAYGQSSAGDISSAPLEAPLPPRFDLPAPAAPRVGEDPYAGASVRN